MIQAAAVRSTLNYTLDDGRPRVLYFYRTEPGTVVHKPGDDPREVSISAGWDEAGRFSLDREGFELHPCDIAFTRFDDERAVRSEFFAEVTRFVRERVGARRVHVFDYNLRVRKPNERGTAATAPVRLVHTDYTESSGPQRVRDLLPDEAPVLLQRRVAFYNVWKPIRRVEELPLAMCDVTSLVPEDRVRLELRYRERTGEIYAFRYSPAHRWHYFPNMDVNQALLLKCYDSETDGRARFLPHSAFRDPTSSPDAPPRESIEVRTIAFF